MWQAVRGVTVMGRKKTGTESKGIKQKIEKYSGRGRALGSRIPCNLLYFNSLFTCNWDSLYSDLNQYKMMSLFHNLLLFCWVLVCGWGLVKCRKVGLEKSQEGIGDSLLEEESRHLSDYKENSANNFLPK